MGADVSYDAYDLPCVFFVAAPRAELDLLADGVPLRKEHAGRRFGDQQNAGRAQAISFGKGAALSQRDDQGAEIVRSGEAQLRRRFILFRHAAAFDAEAAAEIVTGKRQRGDCGDGGNTGQGTQLSERLVPIALQGGTVFVVGVGHANAHGQDVRGVEAGTQRTQADEAAQKEASACEQHHRQRYFPNEQGATQAAGFAARRNGGSQQAGRIPRGGAQGRDQREQQRAGDGDAHGKRQHRTV